MTMKPEAQPNQTGAMTECEECGLPWHTHPGRLCDEFVEPASEDKPTFAEKMKFSERYMREVAAEGVEPIAVGGLVSKFKHACPEWDGLEIDETFPEFEVCLCFKDKPTFAEKILGHLMKRMCDECGFEAANEFMRRIEAGEHDIPSPWLKPTDKPTFAYSLAMYLTRNNQQHTFTAPEMQAEIEQFLKDKGEVR